MAPVARELSPRLGVLEPLQTATSVGGQVEELQAVLARRAHPPVALAGYSWGAWLSLILAARRPDVVSRLILISCPPLTGRYASLLSANRLARLAEDERREFAAALAAFEDPGSANRDVALIRLGRLAAKADSYAPAGEEEDDAVKVDAAIYSSVWPEAAAMRGNGELLRLAGAVRCPVVAIHGEADPSPAEGVRQPLAPLLPDFRLILLPRCGHTPWKEPHARANFFDTLKSLIEP